MSKPKLPGDPTTLQVSSTRVDSAHRSLPDELPRSSEPSIELLHAIAGYATEHSEQQTREQASELANILRDKQKLLDQRESELNARTALLENELRVRPSRRGSLTRFDAGIDLGGEIEASPETVEAPSPDPPANASPPRRVASPHDTSVDDKPAEHPTPPHPISDDEPVTCEDPVVADEPITDDTDAVDRSKPALSSTPPDLESTEDEMDNELEDERAEVARQRKELDQQQTELNSRASHIEKMHEEVTTLHRESLELQLATQQLWSELMEDFPSKELAERLGETRNRLRDHFRLANEALAERTEDLHRMRLDLNRQESRLRQQRRELQIWADRRYDEIESRTAQLIQRERELDRLESDFDRQSLQWQEQREAYRNEIGRLASELRSQTA